MRILLFFLQSQRRMKQKVVFVIIFYRCDIFYTNQKAICFNESFVSWFSWKPLDIETEAPVNHYLRFQNFDRKKGFR